jgi:dihydroorotase
MAERGGLGRRIGVSKVETDGDQVRVFTREPAGVLGDRSRRAGSAGLVEGAVADLVVFDRSERWTVTADSLASRGKNTPLLNIELAGRVLVTLAGGRIAYEAPDT